MRILRVAAKADVSTHSLYWGTVFCQTDVCGAWTYAKVRPAWYWFIVRLRFFALIVWRRVDMRFPNRLAWGTAWEVSACPTGFTGPIIVKRCVMRERSPDRRND